MQTLIKNVQDFNSFVEQLKFQDAQKFYSDDIVNVENEDPPTIGLSAKIEKGKAFAENFIDISAELINSIISNDMSVTEWRYQFTNKQTGEKADFNQLSLQRWKDGKIIHERHHYKTDKW